ncbi:MAG: GspH/FimT family pseudopilin [Candidatus Eisenbacteria bacterium]|nr:GspH/FimT family pseudopilin [Candidatus Eisenbacteria bacterium]
MHSTSTHPKGFSLIELMVVLAIFGTLMTFGIPAFQRYMQSAQLRGTSENLVQTIQLQRSRAMATGQAVNINFNTGTPNAWTVLGTSGSVQRKLPRGVTYVSASPTTIQLTRDGHANTSALVVFQNRTGARDTVSIQVSGMALIR